MKDEDEDRGYGGIGDRFHRETRYTANNIGGYSLDWANMPAPYKDYPSSLATIALPEPAIQRPKNIWEVLSGTEVGPDLFSGTGPTPGPSVCPALGYPGDYGRRWGLGLQGAPSAGDSTLSRPMSSRGRSRGLKRVYTISGPLPSIWNSSVAATLPGLWRMPPSARR